MSHGQIRTPVAIKLLNLFDLVAKKDVVACPSPATSKNGHFSHFPKSENGSYHASYHVLARLFDLTCPALRRSSGAWSSSQADGSRMGRWLPIIGSQVRALVRPPSSLRKPPFPESTPNRALLRGFPATYFRDFGLCRRSRFFVMIFGALSLHPKIPFPTAGLAVPQAHRARCRPVLFVGKVLLQGFYNGVFDVSGGNAGDRSR